MKKLTLALLAAGAATLGGAAYAATRTTSTEEPDYRIISRDGDIEIREYTPMIVAEVEVTGRRERAMSEGFRLIADYIFGNNIASDEIEMVAPVTQQASEKIAMTAPVTQQAEGDIWRVRFVMPSKYTLDSLPVPVNPEVNLLEIPSQRVAAIRFSGRASERDILQHRGRLEAYLGGSGMNAGGKPIYAFYDAPWTPGFMRRNEVLIRIES